MSPVLEGRRNDHALRAQTIELKSLITSERFVEQLERIDTLLHDIASAYQHAYLEFHEQRALAFTAAIDEIKGRSEWIELSEDMYPSVLASLVSRACKTQNDAKEQHITLLADGTMYCSLCNATPAQIDSDLAALQGLTGRVVTRVRELTTLYNVSEIHVERVRIAEFFTKPLETDESVDEAIGQLSDYLHKLVAEGVRIIIE